MNKILLWVLIIVFLICLTWLIYRVFTTYIITMPAVTRLRTVEEGKVYKYFLPIFYGKEKKIHSFQIGWQNDENRVFAYQDALGLSGGFDQYLLADYDTITVQIEEWYDWYSIIQPHALVYNKTEKRFRREDEAISWIREHPGKRYIIGNEPDCDLSAWNGANLMSEGEYADFYFTASQLIRNADPTAYIIVGAWAGGIGESMSHNEKDMLRIYCARYGMIDADAFSFHVYQNGEYDNSYPADKLAKFSQAVKEWKSLGWTDTTDILLTEFGWYGLDYAHNTTENCIKFMDWFIPKLQANKQVKGWYWWEWWNGSQLIINGEPTETGLHYKESEE